jgi:hypothetical protein
MKIKFCFFPLVCLLSAVTASSQTITSIAKLSSPTVSQAGNLITNGGFETGAPPVNTWYQWAKTGCNPTPANRNPPSWVVTASGSNSSSGNPVRYATWGRLVTGTGGSGTYPFIPTTQQGVYEVYSTSSTACTITNTTATSNDPGTFPAGVASVDGNNYLYFGNGTGSVTGFPTPLTAWVNSAGPPNNLRVYTDNASLGTLTGPAPVTLAQTITTVAGTNYRLEFWVSGEEIDLNTQKDGFFQLQIGTQNLYLAIPGSGNDHGLGKQFYYQVNFDAAAASTTIKFINYCHPVGGNWNGYLAGAPGSELLLDDVRMNITSVVLPVKLVSFDAQKNNTAALLQWTTANEINFDRFEIESCANGINKFITTGTVMANNSVKYFFTDVNAFAKSTLVYYRLKLIDKNGSFSYSNIVAVNFNDKLPVIIRPAVVKRGEPVLITTTGTVNSNYTITLLNSNGQLIESRKTVQGSVTVLPTNSLVAGIYFISVTGSNINEKIKLVIW